jgi:type IV pilus assembly protein PilW
MKLNPIRLRSHGEKGFSLLELLIAMVIFLIVTGAIYGLMEVGRIDRNRSSRRSDVLKNARVAVHMIGRDALNAGLGYHRRGAVVPDNFLSTRIGIPTDADSNRDMLTSVVAGDDLFTNNLSANTATRTDTIAFCYRDVDFNAGNVIGLQGVSAPSGSPTVARLTANTPTGAAQAQPYDLYLIESDTSQVAIMGTTVNGSNQIDAAPGDPLGLNQPLDGTGANGSVLRQCTSSADQNCTTYLASAKRFFLVSYKVKPDGTLVRTVFGNNRGAGVGQQIVELPLAYNIEDFQIRYVLSDGTVMSNPTVGIDGIPGTIDDDMDKFNSIRQITVTVKVQSTEIDERTGKPESITLNATFSTRNMGYDAG